MNSWNIQDIYYESNIDITTDKDIKRKSQKVICPF